MLIQTNCNPNTICMNPSFQEAPISQIPALRLLQQLGFSYLASEYVAVERKRKLGRERRQSLVVSKFSQINDCKISPACEISRNRPATPLHDAHQGGCFMYAVRIEGGDQ
jgi:hypothetical protein